MNVVVCKNPAELGSRAAVEFVRIGKESISERGSFLVALSGGSTPILLYKQLLAADLDWNRVAFYFGDERNVPADEDASNFRSANQELFRPLRIREDRIYRWRTELDTPEQVAADYQERLEDIGPGLPRFDLILLGMGSDGHTASLFPGTEALHETQRFAVANWVSQLGSWRFTLTFPVINNARNVFFLVAGTDKAETLSRVLETGNEDDNLPARRIQPTQGELNWFVIRPPPANSLPQRFDFACP
jgi:6-phosphogluconolactonase